MLPLPNVEIETLRRSNRLLFLTEWDISYGNASGMSTGAVHPGGKYPRSLTLMRSLSTEPLITVASLRPAYRGTFFNKYQNLT